VGISWCPRVDGVRFVGKLGMRRVNEESFKGISRPFNV
jgi:hypothetical protein